jgi:hypothetical protein
VFLCSSVSIVPPTLHTHSLINHRNKNEIRKRKANWIGHCLLQQVIEGKIKGQIEVKRRRGRRRKKLLGDLKDRTGQDTVN